MKKGLKFNDFIKNNSGTILTVVGSIGVCITAAMAARDTIKAMKRIEEREANEGYLYPYLDTKDKFKVAAPCYIPTVISGVATILCICSANKLNKNVQKSLTSAYMLLDNSYKEYRKSVQDIYGEESDQRVIEKTADRKAEETNLTKQDDTDVFFDYFSLQFFNSKLSTVKDAEIVANSILQKEGYISLRTLYSLFGQPIIGTDDLLGWSIGAGKEYGYERVEIDITPMTRGDGTTYYVIDFVNGPTEDYLRLMYQ